MLPSQRRGLANSGLNLLKRLRLDGWERSVTLGEGFQNLDLKEKGAVVYMTSGEIRWVHRNPSVEGKNLA